MLRGEIWWANLPEPVGQTTARMLEQVETGMHLVLEL
jgi:hypothetical protein